MNEQLMNKVVAYVRGKKAGNEVSDCDGNVIVARGDEITDKVIQQAIQRDQLQYLMIAAASTAVQGKPEAIRQRLEQFEDISESHEAEFVRGEIAGRDVKDFQGNIIVKQGETISDDIIMRAGDEGILQELVLAVGAPGIELKKAA